MGSLPSDVAIPMIALFGFNFVQLGFCITFAWLKRVAISAQYVVLLASLFVTIASRFAVIALWWLDSMNSPAQSFCVRVSVVSSLGAMLVMLWAWIVAVHSQFPHGTVLFFRIVMIALFATFAGVGLFFFISGIVVFAAPSDAARAVDKGAFFLALAMGIFLGCAFLMYGIVLSVLLRRSQNDAHRKQIKTVLLVAVAIFCGYMCGWIYLVKESVGVRVSTWFILVVPLQLLCFVVLALFLSFVITEADARVKGEYSLPLLGQRSEQSLSSTSSSYVTEDVPAKYII